MPGRSKTPYLLLLFALLSGQALLYGRPSESRVLSNWQYLSAQERPDKIHPDYLNPLPAELAQQQEGHWRNAEGQRPMLKNAPSGRIWMRVRLPEYQLRDPVLFMPLIYQSMEVYLLGERGPRRIYKFGELKQPGEPVWDGFPMHMVALPAGSSGRYVYLRLYTDGRAIGIRFPVRLGARGDIITAIIRKDLDRVFVSVLGVFLGLFGFVVFVRRPQDYIYLYYALFAISVGGYLFSNRTLQFQQILWWAPQFWWYTELSFLYMLPVWSGAFIYRITENPIMRYWWKGYSVYAVLSLLAFYAGLLPVYKYQVPIFGFLAANALLYMGLVVWGALRGNRESRIISLGIVVMIMVAVYDILGVLQLVPWPRQLTSWGMLVFMLFFASILILRFRNTYLKMQHYSRELETAQAQLKDHAENLELKVTERTREVNESLEKLNNLKTRQDGDYYLTSQIMKPLIRLKEVCDTFKVDILVKQKKSFNFKGSDVELGGDIANTQPLFLGGKEYMAFLNGDAMGKSMQGAGGAIVLGVVYNSLVRRENTPGENKISDPHEWLSFCLKELRHAFWEFKGGMLATLVLGLLDPEGGRVIYINAEHPLPVLYREGKARLVREAGIAPRLGFEGDAKVVHLNTVQLQAGDIFLVGSDGRDDIQIGNDESGRIINDDDQAFLRIVEQAEGRLSRIEQALSDSGDLIDDLSLLSIEYKA